MERIEGATRSSTTDARWVRLSALIAEHMGLHYPQERLADLQRGVAAAAPDFGFTEAEACADWLLSIPLEKPQLDTLANHLTVGETYFFREKPTWEVLSRDVLPPLIAARRGRAQRLRFWSAACCTGEEPYSLAILLHQLLPDIHDWQVTILATDINASFLQKAIAGRYREWSFRDNQASLRERYFDRTADGRYDIRAQFRRLVRFEHLNLVTDSYPSLATDTNAMDLILCRNVLMYFTAGQIARVVAKLHRSLVDGGWLAVSPSEASQMLFRQFATRSFPGAILYQRSEPAASTSAAASQVPRSTDVAAALGRQPEGAAPRPTSAGSDIVPAPPLPDARATAMALHERGQYAEAADVLLASAAVRNLDPATFSLLTRALANAGRLTEALAWCERWLAADRVNPIAYYLRAVVLMEQDGERLDEARQSLRRAVYLDPELVLAHFALGNVARAQGAYNESNRHFLNAMQLLQRLGPDYELRDSDGLTAGRLMETIRALTALPELAPDIN